MRITSDAPDAGPTPRRVELIVWTMAFTTFAYVSLSVSLSPLLTAIASEFEVSESAVGQLATVQGVVGTISAILSAPWMGRFSRRAWLRAELALLCVGVALSALAPGFPVLVAARVLIGIAAGALVANCFTAAGEVVRDTRRQGRAVGIVASGTTLATMIGLPLIAWLNELIGWRGALACVLVPLGLSLLGTSLLPARAATASTPTDTGHGGAALDLGSIGRTLRGDRATAAIILASGSIFVAYIGWLTYYSASVERDYGGSARLIGLLFLAGGTAELVGNFGAPMVSNRVSVRLVAVAGLAGMALTLLASDVVVRSTAGLVVAIALLHLFTSFAYVGVNTLLVQRPAAVRGMVLALSSAAIGFGGALGALLGGVVLAATGRYPAVFQLMGALVGLAAIGLWWVFRTSPAAAVMVREAE